MDCCCCHWFSGYETLPQDDGAVQTQASVQQQRVYGATESNHIERTEVADQIVTASYQYVTPATALSTEDAVVEPTSELSSRTAWESSESPPIPEEPIASSTTPQIITPLKHRNVMALTPSRTSTPEQDATSDTSSQSSRNTYYYLSNDIPRTGSPSEARKTGFRCIQCRKRFPRDHYSLNQQKKLPSNSARCKVCVQTKQEWH